MRNALQEEISGSSDKEAVLITLNRPIVFAQPVAFDRGKPIYVLCYTAFLYNINMYFIVQAFYHEHVIFSCVSSYLMVMLL